MDVQRPSLRRRVAIDFFDRSDRFSLDALAKCDVYFTRNYYEPHLDPIPWELRKKIKPFGINYASRTAASRRNVLATLGPDLLRRLIRDASRGMDALMRGIHEIQPRGFLKSPPIHALERPPYLPLEPLILFQTRAWPANEVGPGEDSEAINDQRVSLVQALRKHFPKHYVGGVIPTPFAKERYPDMVSARPHNRSAYLHWSRHSLIGIHTRGLHYSIPAKLGEYMAASKCIVSDPIRNELPVQPVREQHYLEFRDPEQCVEQCERILRDPDLAAYLREQAWAYYQSHVNPTVRAWAVLKEACREQSVSTRG